MNNLKNIAFAVLNYEANHGCFPPPYVADKNGQSMHSWRTLILPHIVRTDLYEAYDFDEPWDGPNNKKLSTIVIDLILCPSSPNNRKPITNYVAVTGPGTVWDSDKSTNMDDISDGTENTILLVELGDSNIHWMEPRDITQKEALGKPGDGVATVPNSGHFSEGSYFFKSLPIFGNIAMANGRILCLRKRLSTDDLAALLSIDGGEKIDIDQLLEQADYPLYQRLRWDHVIGLPLFLASLLWFWYRLLQKPVEPQS